MKDLETVLLERDDLGLHPDRPAVADEHHDIGPSRLVFERVDLDLGIADVLALADEALGVCEGKGVDRVALREQQVPPDGALLRAPGHGIHGALETRGLQFDVTVVRGGLRARGVGHDRTERLTREDPDFADPEAFVGAEFVRDPDRLAARRPIVLGLGEAEQGIEPAHVPGVDLGQIAPGEIPRLHGRECVGHYDLLRPGKINRARGQKEQAELENVPEDHAALVVDRHRAGSPARPKESKDQPIMAQSQE